MPADCEIDRCGVIADGRCRQCGRAMCRSHRAYEPNRWTIAEGRCTSCFQGILAQETQMRDDAKARLDTARATVKRLATALVAAGAKPETRFGTSYSQTYGGFPRKMRTTCTPLYGWYVGDFPWRLRKPDPESPTYYQQTVRTFVTSDGGVAHENSTGPRTGEQTFDGVGLGVYPGLTRRGEAEAWEGVARALEALARTRGVN